MGSNGTIAGLVRIVLSISSSSGLETIINLSGNIPATKVFPLLLVK